jgi:hypothetical protein
MYESSSERRIVVIINNYQSEFLNKFIRDLQRFLQGIYKKFPNNLLGISKKNWFKI